MAGRVVAWRAGRRAALLALVVAVVAVHGCVASSVAERMADFAAAESMPPRMDVAWSFMLNDTVMAACAGSGGVTVRLSTR